MGTDMSKINEIAGQIDKESFHEVIHKLHRIKKIYIIGAGVSEFPVQWLYFTLDNAGLI